MQLGIFAPATHALQIRWWLLLLAWGQLGRSSSVPQCVCGISISGKQPWGHTLSAQGDITPLLP